ncbi:unnamed protein product [Brassicogethes aeneus]|uniref:Uncharacterized protein n=1 Tax=Brassicogethes aeneus TaxID=1431903 RepID=A0A9P0B797_BRAAE|nr:unnamed protein product [Brassicogethes aeneus]
MIIISINVWVSTWSTWGMRWCTRVAEDDVQELKVVDATRPTPEWAITNTLLNFIDGVWFKEGAKYFLFHPQRSQSLICKSNNTPNYQVNMAILYGRWKEA